MGTITAVILGGFTAFNQFLCTAAGQKFALASEEIVGKLLNALGVHLVANIPAGPDPTAPPK